MIFFWFLVNYFFLFVNGFYDFFDIFEFCRIIERKKKLSENIDIICLYNLIYLKYFVLDLINFCIKGIIIRNKIIFEG